MTKITRSALVSAAKDLNKVLDLSPPIDVKLGVSELREQVTEAASLVKDSDSVEDDTRDLLEALEDGEEAEDASSDDADTEADADSPKEKKAKTKTVKKAKTARQKKSNTNRTAPSKYEGSFAQRVDNALLKGGTMDEITEEIKNSGAVPSSVKSLKSAVKLCMKARTNSGKYEIDESDGKIKMSKKGALTEEAAAAIF